MTIEIHQQLSTWEGQVPTQLLLHGLACFLVCCRWRKREGSGILEYNLNCMDWIHMANLPRDFIEFEFLYSSRLFLVKQYCNHEVYTIIKIIKL